MANEPNTATQSTTQTATQPEPATVEKTIPYARFKEVNERAKALETRIAEIEKSQTDAQQKELAKQGEFQKLAEAEKVRAEKLAAEYEALKVATVSEKKRSAMMVAAIKAGAIDAGDVVKLADFETVTVGDNGEPQGADTIIDTLKKAKPHMFGQAKVPGVNNERAGGEVLKREDYAGKGDMMMKLHKENPEQFKIWFGS